MLMAHPAVLQRLVDQYEALRTLHAEAGDEAARQRMDDVAYTLCVSTGTRDVDTALISARYHLPGARVQDDSLLSSDDDTEPAQPVPGGV
ncbi:DUF5133 domain-containing protein [Streptomyces sp. 71268]|uniref:DUF5133 domain-containing protein n=1 Tax=Streptomyces sp. 71268 TaxID=3002640 RepID=UPI0023F8E842|nr:DUF5133 domain-containing protein [Streptomyces sp. 71268]WEV25587.1 DUF5133 domain-containing protein [Streptomyces sp. 71268]